MRLLRCLKLRFGSDTIGGVVARPHPVAAKKRPRAFTLIEVMIATGVFTLAFAGLYAASNHVMNLIRRSEDSAIAQRNCLARMDQLRTAAWAKVTSPAHLASLLAVPTAGKAFKREVISVYKADAPQTTPPAPTPVPPVGSGLLFTVTRAGGNAPVISPANFDQASILDAYQLNFRVTVEWDRTAGAGQRELSTVISKSASR